MTSLFYPAKFNGGLAGSKLYFYQTGTGIPQNTYTDEALTVASSNPVVADAAGVFAAIYLDPRLPSYTVRWETAAGVLIYQQAGYPSNQNIGGVFRLEATIPTLLFYDTNGTADQRKMKLLLGPDGLEFYKVNDAESVSTLLKTVLWDKDTILYKASDSPRSNNTLLIDPDLQVTFNANVGLNYEFDAFLIFRCASATPGVSLQFANTAGTCRYTLNGSADAATAFADAINLGTTSGTSFGWPWTNTARHIVSVKGYILSPTNGSTFALYWSQTVTNANALNLEAGSFLRVRQVRL